MASNQGYIPVPTKTKRAEGVRRALLHPAIVLPQGGKVLNVYFHALADPGHFM